MVKEVKLYDATLRDGAQKEGISFSVDDKVKITQRLDDLGVHYIEGGYPASNPKEFLFFEKMKGIKLKHAKLAAFGMTRRAKTSAEKDENLKALLKSETKVVTIVGKSSPFQVEKILKVSLKTNLALITSTIKYLKSKNREVIYDAEHFFDGYRENSEYALETLKCAAGAGADTIVLCDTNGGTLPDELARAIRAVRKVIKLPLGIHTHNDADLAVSNTILAVQLGCNHIQGTINGYGERCGNANLCSVIPTLQIKLNIKCLPEGKLKELKAVSLFVSETANLLPREDAPYVGASAFAHKGGMHVSAVRREARAYEHIPPELVGNTRRILISELSGKGTILYKSTLRGWALREEKGEVERILAEVKRLESEGYHFEGAEGSFELLVKRIKGEYRKFFTLLNFRVIVERDKTGELLSEATVKLKVGDTFRYTVAEGNGPVNALDRALREALEEFYPSLREMQLVDYKVRILDSKSGTRAITRVFIESKDHEEIWTTVGVSENIIEASWQALVESIEYKFLKDGVEEYKGSS
jgi:2-isopropylmalate synthase